MVAEPQQTIGQECRDHQADYRRRLAQRSKVYQILEMQEDIKAELAKPISPMQKAALYSAWDRLEERIRILLNRPLPGSLKPEQRSKRLRAMQSSALADVDEHAHTDVGSRAARASCSSSTPSNPR